MLRWGILGPSGVATRELAPAMLRAGHELTAVASRSRSRAQAFAAYHGARRARASYHDVLTAEDVDAVYIALPNDLHEPWVIAALQAGKHVLCEKPLGHDAAAAQRMAVAAARSGRVLMEAAMVRFHPRTEALLELTAGGAIGRLRTVHVAVGVLMEDPTSFRAEPSHGGGALLDVGSHAAALARWVTGEEPEQVVALDRRWSTGVDGTTGALLRFPSGTIATLTASFDTPTHDLLVAVGSHGVVEVPRVVRANAEEDAVLLRDGQVVGSWRVNPYERMVDRFARGCRSGVSPLPVEDALGTALVLDAIADAARVTAVD